MKKLLLLLLCVPLIGFGQTWEKTYGGIGHDRGNSVQQTTDGGYIITGDTYPEDTTSNTDVYLLKTDGSGIEQWTKTFGGTSYDLGKSVQQTTDGGYIITGWTNSFGNGSRDVYLIKTDGNGDSLWTKTFDRTDYDYGYSVQQTTDGGYIITGLTWNLGNGPCYVYLIKTDGNGDSLWTKTFDRAEYNEGQSVQQTTDGGYIITGFTSSFGIKDVYLIKTDGNGDSLWTKTFGGPIDDYGYSVQQTTDGGYIITGFTNSFGNGGYDVYLIKTDGNGDSLWTKTFDRTDYDEGRSVQQTTDGGYIITGVAAIGAGDVYLIKTDGSGVEQWTKTFGGTDEDFGYSVQQTTDGGYIITGFTNSFGNGNDDVYLIKTDGNGNVTSEFTIPMISNRELKKVVDILGRDVKPEKNKPFIEIYNDGTVEKKIIIE